MRPFGSKEALEKRRRMAIGLLQRGLSTSEVATAVGATRTSVWRWKQTFETKGAQALESKRHPGRKPKLTEAQFEQLKDLVDRGPRPNGFDIDGWTLPFIRLLIQQVFDKTYDVRHLWRVMKRLGYSCQKPQKVAQKRDDRAVATWRKKTWPKLKKKPNKKTRASS